MTRWTRWTRNAAAAILAAAFAWTPIYAQHSRPTLHVNPRWKECSLQLDAGLTLAAWKQFSEEAGLVTYFRPLADARPMGKGRFDLSILQWTTAIDDSDAAWNDTFVHPDSAHWLFEGDGLAFPGLMGRIGVTDRTDAGFYFTRNPNANYGFYGAQVQHAFLDPQRTPWGVATRLSVVSLFGPEDLTFAVAGLDVVASRTFTLNRLVSVSPYAIWSSVGTYAHEKSPVVDLPDQAIGSSQTMLGATMRLSWMTVGVEYSAAKVRSTSLRIGFGG